MGRKSYTKEFLISELKRFYDENGRVPKCKDMISENGYPSFVTYQNYFGSWNNALKAANLPLNQYQDHWRDGTETCCKCNCSKKEGQSWHTKGLLKSEVMCDKCYYDSDYLKGELDKNSTTGFAFVSQRIVANVLGLELKNDCNCSCGFNHPYDLYDRDRYGKIDVKASKLNNNNNWENWVFTLKSKKEVLDTYTMLGFDKNRKNILHVWIANKLDDLVYNKNNKRIKSSISITNTYESLDKAKPWEVDVRPYNDALHSMNLDTCGVLRND